MQKNRFAFLDGLRGMAAIFVLMRHTQDLWHFEFFRSYLAVDLFFILSGFVIAYAYDNKLSTGVFSFSKFMKVRLIRLYPVFLLSISICAAVILSKAMLHHQVNADNWLDAISLFASAALFIPIQLSVSSTLFLPSVAIGLFPMNIPYWSLFFELIVNAAYALLRPLLTSKALIFIVSVSAIILTVLSYRYGNLSSGWFWGYESIITGLARATFGIFSGLLLHRHHANLLRFVNISPLVAYVLVAIVLTSPSLGGLDWLIDSLAVMVVFPLAVIIASQSDKSKLAGVFTILGAASYPMYVLHQPLGSLFYFKGLAGQYAPISGIVFVVLMIGISVLVDKFYDTPVRKWIGKKGSNLPLPISKNYT